MYQFLKKIFRKINTSIQKLSAYFFKKKPTVSQSISAETQVSLDKKLIAAINPQKLPSYLQLKQLHRVLSQKEKNIIYIAIAVIAAAAMFWGLNFYKTRFKLVPVSGGEYTEGVVGAPRYINPLLAYSNDPDLDLVQLMFSGLLRFDSSLNIVEDMAEKFTISEDKKTYAVTLKKGLSWHDGKPVTVHDILFTYESVRDPNFKSPLRSAFRGIKIEKNEQEEIVFTLNDPSPSFPQLLTIGILPEHIWGKISPINSNLTEFNLRPIGSGPWKLKNFTRDGNGNIKTYILIPNENYHGEKPYIKKLTLKFFQNFDLAIDALNNRSIEGVSYVAKDKKPKIKNPNTRFYSYSLPQYTAIFFNLKNEILKDARIRKALAYGIDKAAIFAQAAKLQGEIVSSPILPTVHGVSESDDILYRVEEAKKLLDESGWTEITREEKEKIVTASLAETSTTTATSTPPKMTEEKEEDAQNTFRKKEGKFLKITLTTIDIPEYATAAKQIESYWQNIGVETDVIIMNEEKFLREAIKPRNFQAVLYGENYGRDSDPYYFWHSSQTQDPGLNLSQYANRITDKILENARVASAPDEKKKLLEQLKTTLQEDMPAVFLYSPTYTYAVDEKVRLGSLEKIVLPSDRFIENETWYIFTGRRLKE